MKEGTIILGIDEAGRGCVIGPLVVCGVLIEERAIPELKAEGVTDSKALTPTIREQLAPKVRDAARQVFVEEIPPSEIDERNLNLLEMWRIRRIIAEAKPDIVYLDAPVATEKGIKAFCEQIKRCLPDNCPKIVAENRADATYVVVGAASIVAKVRRDEIVAELRRRFGDFGSGYPSDERTQRFLRDCYAREGRFPDFVRCRWKTIRRFTEPVETFLPFADGEPP